MDNSKILCVDLDGTLVRTDTIYEILAYLFKNKIGIFFLVVLAIFRGRPYFKKKLFEAYPDIPLVLPFNKEFLEYLKNEKENGRKLVLVTAANQGVADKFAREIPLFDAAFGSDEKRNLKSHEKAAFLNSLYGKGEYDYAGNSSADYAVWESTHEAIVVNASICVTERAKKVASVSHIFDKQKSFAWSLLKAIRPHQFSKNLLVFLPFLTNHIYSLSLFTLSCLAFIAFSLITASVYLINDTLDAQLDRMHPKKQHRPIANGDLNIQKAFFCTLFFLITGFAIAYITLPFAFFLFLMAYFLITQAYNFLFKQHPVIDAFSLTILYTLRLLAGIAAINAFYSPWLIGFSLFFFLSLAFTKRDIELYNHIHKHPAQRKYLAEDKLFVQIISIVSGYMSILILALYTQSQIALSLYQYPYMLWAIILMLSYWLTRVFFLANRGEIDEDPVSFALRDKLSWFLVILSIFLMIWA